MSDILSSQISDVPQVFHNPDGSRWHVFVEAGGITARPRLIRTLKKAGAVVCADPKQAQVILVDSTSIQGKLFVRDWGKDENKVVLEYSWVKKSIASGRVLNESEQWGGCLTYDDGLPIMKEEIDDVPKSPLPTPRITPTETVVSPVGRRKPVSTINYPHDMPTTDITQINPAPAYASNRSTLNSNARILSPDHHHHIQPQELPSHMLNTQLSQPQTSIEAYSHLPFQYQAGPSNGPEITGTLMDSWNHPFSMALLDALKARGMAGMVPWGPPSGPSTHLSSLNSQMMVPAMPSLVDYSPHTNMSRGTPGLVPNEPYQTISTSRSLSDLPPSLRRKSPTISSSLPVTRTPKRRYRAASPHSRSTPLHSTSPRLLSQPGSLFTSETGEELSFFVQIDLNNRFSVVSAIKKNGGKIINSHTNADYAVLYSRSKTFSDLLNSTLAANKLAVSASFVHDSVERNALMDPAQYSFDTPSSRDKRKRARCSSETSEDDSAVTRSSKNARLVPQKRSKDEKTIKDVKNIAYRSDNPGLRSPTPPPEHTRIKLPRGYKFSEYERDYATRYVKVLLERDHQMTTNNMAQALSKKMNHHSTQSWRAFLSQNARDDVEATRKRMSIAYRKGQSINQASQHHLDNNEKDHDIEPTSKQASPSPTPKDQESKLAEDLEFMSNFFVADDGNEDDAHVWHRLTSQKKCLTAKTWEDFYNKYHVEVNARYHELIQINPSENDSVVGSNTCSPNLEAHV